MSMPNTLLTKAAQLAQTQFFQTTIQYSSIVLIWYDYVLTFPAEVKYMWRQRLRLSTILYICTRYALIGNLLFLFTVTHNLQGASCHIWYKFIGTMSVFGRTAVVITLAGRTTAVYGRNKIIMGVLGALGLAIVILDLLHIPDIKCRGSAKSPLSSIILNITIIVFEFLTTILATIRTFQALRVEGVMKRQKGSFVYLVMEQGILYFLFISVFTTASAVVNFKAPGGFVQRFLNAVTLPLSGMLTARFLLHLRSWDQKDFGQTPDGEVKTRTETLGTVGEMEFNRQTRRSGRSDDDEEEDEYATRTTSSGHGFIDDFGEDPVMRQRNLAQRGVIEMEEQKNSSVSDVENSFGIAEQSR